jgi:hypothetical protein
MKIHPYWSYDLESVNAQLLRGLDLENLTTLDIHLRTFQADNSVGDWLTRMPSLLTLSLSGS